MMCIDDDQFLLGQTNFNYSSTSEFVEFLRTMTDQRSWFESAQATWNGLDEPQFVETILSQGLGFTFNMIDLADLLIVTTVSDDFNFKVDKDLKPTPWRTSADVQSGLSITLKLSSNMLHTLNGCYHTFNTFIIHTPYQLPDTSHSLVYEFSYGLSHDVFISVDVVETDEDLRHVGVEKRQCYFNDEMQLKYFKFYTKQNCERECFSEYSYQRCSCVPFYYIRNKTMKVCDILGTECTTRFMFDSKAVCKKCFPECNLITYKVETVSARYDENFSDG